MRILVLRNLGKPFPPLTEGWIGEVEESVGRAILSAGLAIDKTQSATESIRTDPKPAELTTAPTIEATPIIADEPAKAAPSATEDESESATRRHRRGRQQFE